MDRKSQLFRRGFTLMELMIVVGIIAVLVSILIPTISKIRIASQTASTKALLDGLKASILEYKATFSAFPGPLPDNGVVSGNLPYVGGSFGEFGTLLAVAGGTTPWVAWPSGLPPVPTASAVTVAGVTPATYQAITGTNNLVLGLMGGMRLNGSLMIYDPAYVGRGPFAAGALQRTSNGTFYDGSKDLSWRDVGGKKTGKFEFEGGVEANDCPIPSLVDRYSQPMPILYLRAVPGINPRKQNTSDANPTVIEYNVATAIPARPYNLAHIVPYTGSKIGYASQVQVGAKNFKLPGGGAGYHGLHHASADGTPAWPTVTQYPYEANQYLSDPSYSNQPRGKDEYVLISAGPDRIYGTDDDVTSFGDVKP